MDEAPGSLGVGFNIDPGESFSLFGQIEDRVDRGTARMVEELGKVEEASRGMLNVGPATAAITAFGSAHTRETRDMVANSAKAERAAISLAEKIERELATFGMSKAELRDYNAELKASAAQKAGMTDAADRLRAAVAALSSEEEAASEARRRDAAADAAVLREAAWAHQMFEARVRQGATAMREGEAAAEKDSAAAARLREMLDPASAAQARLNAELREAKRVMAATGASGEELARVEKLLRDRASDTADAARKSGLAWRQVAVQMPDVVEGLASGQSLMTILIEQGGQIAQQAMVSGASFGEMGERANEGSKAASAALDGLKDKAVESGKALTEEHGVGGALSKVMQVLTPVRMLIGGTAVAVALATKSWLDYSNAMDRANALAQGSGRLIGASGAELETAAEAAAKAGNITVGAARDIVAAYVQAGHIGTTILPGLTAATNDFATATGQKVEQASQELAQAFADPAKGADELTAKYGILSAATLDYVHTLVEQGREAEAQQVLLKGLESSFVGAADHANILARAWRNIKNEASEAWVAMGQAIDRALGGGDLSQRIADLRDERAHLQVRGLPTTGTDQRIADLQKQLAAEKAKEDNNKAHSDAVAGMKIVDAYTGDDKRGDLVANQTALKKLTANDGKAAGLDPDQLKNARVALDAYTHAVDTYLSPAEKKVQLDALDAKIAAAKTPALKAALNAQKAQVQQYGEVVTSAQAEAAAHSASARALATASKAGDNHAAQLAREAAAIVAQTSNVYLLAASYGVSGGQALIAEARVKAESKAIKDRGDIEAAVSREVRLAVAQRVSDAEKSAASLRAQTGIEEQVNAQVRAGTISLATANDVVRDRIALIPLLDALEAARLRNDVKGIAEATRALADLAAAQARSNATKLDGAVLRANRAADDELARLNEELRLIAATDAARVHALAGLKAQQDAVAMGLQAGTAGYDEFINKQVQIADGQQALTDGQRRYNEALAATADHFSLIDDSARLAAQSMSDAFGAVGRSVGDALTAVTSYYAKQSRLEEEHTAAIKRAGEDQAAIDRANATYAIQSTDARMAGLLGVTSAAKGFFKENSAGYRAMEAAEKALAIVQLARTAVAMAEGAANMFAVGGPAGFALVAAMVAVMASLGFSGGSSVTIPSAADRQKAQGTGTVLGDASTKSDSISHALQLVASNSGKDLEYGSLMSRYLRNIDNNIGSLTTEIAKQLGVGGALNAQAPLGYQTGSSASAAIFGLAGVALSKLPVLGDIFGALDSVISKIPVFGSIITGLASSLFGKKTVSYDVNDYGLDFGGGTVGGIASNGLGVNTYQEILETVKKSALFGLVKSTSQSLYTNESPADAEFSKQVQLLVGNLRDSIVSATNILGIGGAQSKLEGLQIDLGKVSFKDMSTDDIEKTLENVFSKVGDQMAAYVGADFVRFQKAGEGAFETLIRVATSVQQVDSVFQRLGKTTTSLGVDVDMAIASMFDNVSDFTDLASSYFETYYSQAEQTAARTSQLTKAMQGMGLTLPTSIDAYRKLVDAQDLTTDAGRQMYVTLLQLAPTFASLQGSLNGAASAADILNQRADLQQKLLELQGNTVAIRAAELAKLDPSNRALQQQIYDLTDAQAAAKTAQDLADAWKSVGDSILDEINRIRGLGDATGTGSFATLMGQFNAANAAAQGGDMDAAKSLPGLSKSLLDAAAKAATSRQELDRVQAQTAAMLEATYGKLGLGGITKTIVDPVLDVSSIAAGQSTSAASANDNPADAIELLRADLADTKAQLVSALAQIAGNTAGTNRRIDELTADSGGTALATTVTNAEAA